MVTPPVVYFIFGSASMTFAWYHFTISSETYSEIGTCGTRARRARKGNDYRRKLHAPQQKMAPRTKLL
jgi:hypothetical protein